MGFKEQLAFGLFTEQLICEWLLRRGCLVLPVSEEYAHQFKGPRILGCNEEVVSPDILIAKQNRLCWIEVKGKRHFTRWRETGVWQTGIDTDKYEHYLRSLELFKWPVWVLFLHYSNRPSGGDLRFAGCPQSCPAGLFGNSLEYLSEHVDHYGEPEGWCPEGMVYWSLSHLEELATLEQINAVKDARISPLEGMEIPI